MRPALAPDEFAAWLAREGGRRYHSSHPFHARMHAGELGPSELRCWVTNRYYYQSRIPVKDALIVAKSDDPAFRRWWVSRIHDQDGPGRGLDLWLRLAAAVGCDPGEVASFRAVLPGVRFACDAYVSLVREASLAEAVAASLTEWFAPELMSRRIAAWRRHYPWVGEEGLAYFRDRVPRARHDGEEAFAFVVREASTYEAQERCVAALVRKTEILWHVLDCIERAGAGAPR